VTSLRDILPLKLLQQGIGAELVYEEFGKEDLTAIAKRAPGGLFGIAANVWNRIVFKKWHSVDPQALAASFQRSDPELHLVISDKLSIEVIRDIYYVRGWKASRRSSNLVVEMLVAHVYRDDLQLADITMRDPGRPLLKAQRRFAYQTHKGLGLLPTLMDNMQVQAKKRHCDQLTLTAATRDQVELFLRYGFVVERSPSGRIAMQLGFGIPMERNVKGTTQI
jgi:hypothetical protein